MPSLLRRFFWVGLTAFGAARWTNLEAEFVRSGLVPEEKFIRDLAIAQTLPGPPFVNLSMLTAMRLGGMRLALLALALILLPGTVAVVLCLAFLSLNDPWVARLLHGILIGAVGVMAATFIRQSRRVRGLFAAILATATLVLLVVGVSIFETVLIVGAIGVVRYRFQPQTLP